MKAIKQILGEIARNISMDVCKYCEQPYEEKSIEVDKLGTYKIKVPLCNCLKIQREKEEQEEQLKEYKNSLRRYPFLIDYTDYDKAIFKTLDNAQLKCLNELKKYIDCIENGDKKNLYLHCGSGAGKTTFSKYLAKLLAKKGFNIALVDFQRLLSTYKQTFKSSVESYVNSEEYIDNIIFNKEIIIFDDIGAEKPSEWTISKLMEIINARLENKLITIVNTNFSPNQLINRFEKGVQKIAAQRLVGRMVDNAHILNLNTTDYRFKGSINSIYTT